MNLNGIFLEGIWYGWGGGWGGKLSKIFFSMEVGLDVFWNNIIVWDEVIIFCFVRNKFVKDKKRM